MSLNELIVGDDDSLTLFGSELQVSLNDFLRSISTIALRDNAELENLLSDMSMEISKFQKRGQDSSSNFLLKSKKRKHGILVK